MDFLQAEIAHALRQERPRRRRAPSLSVRAEGDLYPIRRLWDGGFAVAVEDAPRLRGFVDLMRGEDRLARCLIVLAEEEDGVVRYEFKRRTEEADKPPLDYEASADAPRALLT